MKNDRYDLKEVQSFLLLWFTQMISGLGSAMTAYALVIWSYTQAGSALRTALLMVCSYTPYVICSIFVGALSDRIKSWHRIREVHSSGPVPLAHNSTKSRDFPIAVWYDAISKEGFPWLT